MGFYQKQYRVIISLFKKIAAKYQGEPCVSYIGQDGSGHYVKMIHNAIEYSDMQLISEVYALLKIGLNLNNKDISNIFSDWNKGELNSYLINITKNIFLKKDLSSMYLYVLRPFYHDNYFSLAGEIYLFCST